MNKIVPPPHAAAGWRLAAFLVLLTVSVSAKAKSWEVSTILTGNEANRIVLVGGTGSAEIVVDPGDFPVVKLAANLLGDDVERVTGKRPTVREGEPKSAQIVLAGTLGHSVLIDRLVREGRLKKLEAVRDHWEATVSQIVEHPFPGVDRAFVIVGSDRRGAAYGLTQLSERIGVSPWYWWADVPVTHRDALVIRGAEAEVEAPSVKYRGIFINDEDWGLFQWASKTFDPAFKNIGPKTYEKVFELMLRLRLNYLWPAMHACSTEFGAVPENVVLADRYGIVMGASHCEPMLRNNVTWKSEQGPWRYDTNHDTIYKYWEEWAKARGAYEAVWTLGIRGIHDAGMQGPPDMPGKIGLLQQAIKDQRELLGKYVEKKWGATAQCFVPYKEVQPIYDAGLEVPPEVTLIWADDNFGYLRRLSSPPERRRAGGAGFYYHLSYYGRPHSYLWINTTAPALIWEEMRKAWDNQARTIWVVNVGDIKPAEIGMDFLARLAWNVDAYKADAQPAFLREFAGRTFGPKNAQAVADLLAEYYRLGQIRKPECMDRAWTARLTANEAAKLAADYQTLLDHEKTVAASIPGEARDAYTEIVGFPARVLSGTGLLFLADRAAPENGDAASREAQVKQRFEALQSERTNYNERIAGGKWNGMSPKLDDKVRGGEWSTLVVWPWLDKGAAVQGEPPSPDGPRMAKRAQRRAADFSRQTGDGTARWTVIEGLGHSGKAVALEPAALESFQTSTGAAAKTPRLEYDFDAAGGTASEASIDFLPTFRVYPGMKLRVAVGVDEAAPMTMEVPGSGGAEDENGTVRNQGVRDNRVTLRVMLPPLASGRHTLQIQALDPGVVIDELSLP